MIRQRLLDIVTIRQRIPASHVAWAVAIFALAILLRALWVNYINLAPGHDGFRYWYAANTMADGDGLRSVVRPDEYASGFPPGWPLVLATLIFMFGPNIVAAKAFNIIAGAITAVLVYVLGMKLRDHRTGIVAGGLMAVFPSQIYFTTTLMAETLFVALATTLVLAMTLWLAGPQTMKLWQALVLGLLLGYMSLVRAETILLFPAAVVLMKLCGSRWRQLALYAPLLLVGMAIVITPWTVRNYVRFDELILIRSASANGTFAPIRTGLSPRFDSLTVMGGQSPTFRTSYEYYRDDPLQIPKQAWRKLDSFYGNDDHFLYFIEPDFVRRISVPALEPNVESRWASLGNVFYYVVAGAALFGAPLWLAKRDRHLLIILWFIASWNLIFLATVPLTRYHFAIIPMITILAAVAFVSAWEWYAKRKPSREEAGMA